MSHFKKYLYQTLIKAKKTFFELLWRWMRADWGQSSSDFGNCRQCLTLLWSISSWIWPQIGLLLERASLSATLATTRSLIGHTPNHIWIWKIDQLLQDPMDKSILWHPHKDYLTIMDRDQLVFPSSNLKRLATLPK